jgi:hypothetical protein
MRPAQEEGLELVDKNGVSRSRTDKTQNEIKWKVLE